jgi:hypothetical protein
VGPPLEGCVSRGQMRCCLDATGGKVERHRPRHSGVDGGRGRGAADRSDRSREGCPSDSDSKISRAWALRRTRQAKRSLGK